MAALEEIIDGARTYLRDTARFFNATIVVDGVARTFDVGHRNISKNNLSVRGTNGTTTINGALVGTGVAAGATTFVYDVDERNGLVRIVNDITAVNGNAGYTHIIEGYYYEWLADQDMWFFANNIVAEHAHNREDFSLDGVSDTEADCMTLGTAVEACWSLLAEYSRDVDVNTPEAVALPVSQRFQHVTSLMFGPMGLIEKYKTKANMLGIGLERIEVFELRRRSRTTGRLVPVYREREWDDARRPQRVFPPINQLGPASPPASFEPAAQVTGYDTGGPNP